MNDCPTDVNPLDVEMVSFAGLTDAYILKFRAMKHDFKSGWETAYLKELHKYFAPNKVVFDIGAEQGEFSVFAAKNVGWANLHLFEASPFYWPNIKRIWEENELNSPYTFHGFIASENKIHKLNLNKGWPKAAHLNIFTETNQITTHQSDYKDLPRITIDTYCLTRDVIPDIIMMDIEGGEVDAIEGAENILTRHSPVVFISVHSDETLNMYGRKKEELFDMMRNFGYNATHINTDHEEHWKFEK